MTDTAAYWNRRALDFDKAHPRLLAIRGMLDRVPHPISTLLDVGCGAGTLRQLLPPSIEYFGVDIAGKVLSGLKDPQHFEVADLEQIKDCFSSRTFDVVVCSGIFEYLHNPEDFIRLLARKTVPGGFMVFSILNRQHHRDLLPSLLGRARRYEDPHVNFLSIRATLDLLKSYGFWPDCFNSLTLRNGAPNLGRLLFPFNVVNRQYVFLLKRLSEPPAERQRLRYLPIRQWLRLPWSTVNSQAVSAGNSFAGVAGAPCREERR